MHNFHQLFDKESSTFTYLLGDPETREAVIIDPVIENLERDFTLIKDQGLKLKYILETHVHADHITASGELRNRTGAKIGISAVYPCNGADEKFQDGSKISFGKYVIHVLQTPGHTSGCVSYHFENLLFTGDTLLIGGCGRTDFQDGSAEALFESVRTKLFSLPDETLVYPAHDYKGLTSTTIGKEKTLNSRLNLAISKNEFISIMANLNLPMPKKIAEAVPANLNCGLKN